MGEQFQLLHPKIREQYSLRPDDRFYWRGRGVMSSIRNGGFHVQPFAMIGSRRRILFTEKGTDVPFIIENHAYFDTYGRPTITWLREFDFEVPRRFDEYLVFSERRQCAVVLAGTRQHLAVDLELSVTDEGAFHLRSKGQRVHTRRLACRFPRIMSGDAIVTERYCDRSDHFEIDVEIRNPIVGMLFAYQGSFTLEQAPKDQPGLTRIRPRTENARE
ncbi:MAG: DUF4166 domain-containing protein [Phycisphaerales bacterium]